MILDALKVSEKNYPLAWLIGKWKGTGQFGGVFDLESSHFVQKVVWSDSSDGITFDSTITLAHIDENGDFIEDPQPLIQEKGVWKISDSRPDSLTDESQFPVEAQIETSWLVKNIKNDNSSLDKVWTTKYVGIVGSGKLEILSDEIDIHNSDLDFANNLWRSKRLFGYVNNRIMWVWDVAQIGDKIDQESGENALKSIASAGIWIDDIDTDSKEIDKKTEVKKG
jgi:hypothetical protein